MVRKGWSLLWLWCRVAGLGLLVGVMGAVPSASVSSPTSPAAGPTLLYPPDGLIATVENHPPTAMPFFAWEAVPGAATYRIQIDGEIGFNEPVEYDKTIPHTRHIPPLIDRFEDGEWYWRVRVESPTPGAWSEVRRFTKSWGAASNAPQLIAPGAGETIQFFEAPVFSWTRVVGAADYVLRIDNDPDCSSPLQTYDTPATHYNPIARLENATYYWMVTPRDAKGREGASSECRQVIVAYAQVPQLLAPANNSHPVYTPRFQWTAVKGAVAYNLYYSTDSSFPDGATIKVKVYQTSYTPDKSLPNDENYYWRVAAVYGSSESWEGPFSETWVFQKQWYQPPRLLTPLDNELTNIPFFSWTPVREANTYHIEASFDPGFNKVEWSADTSNTFYWFHRDWPSSYWNKQMYWRVRAVDASGNKGPYSTQRSFFPVYTTARPESIYPRFYYEPPSMASGWYTEPYNIPISYDYAIGIPTFYWSRTFVPGVDPRQEAHHYKLEVDDDPNFGSVDWVYETQNLSATPSEGAPFTPEDDTDYWWRITAYDATGKVLTDTMRSQPWRTHINFALRPTATATISPQLHYPAHGEVVMDTLPSFQWLPQQGAVRYEIAFSTDPAFASTVYVTRTTYTNHTPVVRFPKGTYFWRVRGLDAQGNTVGQWSEVRRIIVAYQTRWEYTSSYPNVLYPNREGTLIAEDAEDGVGAAELSTLYAAQDKDYWYIGFHVTPTVGSTVWYGLYLDGDQQEGSGADTDPSITGHPRPHVTTVDYYRPEYAIYVVYSGTNFITETVYLHHWNEALHQWDTYIKNLVDPGEVAGGAFAYDQARHYVELRVPKTAIGDLGSSPFVLSLALFSATAQDATSAADTVPDNGAATTVLREFKTIGDRVTLALPPESSTPADPYATSVTPYLYAETANVDDLGGYKVEVSLDPAFSSENVDELEMRCTGCQVYVDVFQYIFSPLKVYGNNTLYWRFAIKHGEGTTISYGPPSTPHRFTKVGPVPRGLHTEGDYSTPTFIWDAVEGAGQYVLQIAKNPDFSPTEIEKTVNHENYTPYEFIKVLPPGKHYWRVLARNSAGFGCVYESDWSPTHTVEITLPRVTIITPTAGAVVHYAPTFRWADVLEPPEQPRWGAPRYRLQVADTPQGFNKAVVDKIVDTPSWTPDQVLADGTYYWRVAVVDVKGNLGPYTEVYSFTKQYPVVQIIAPLTGTTTSTLPIFIWTPVDGAASYRIEIADNPHFSPLYDAATTHNTMFTPSKEYDVDRYYWRVAMIDKSGKYGPWTDSIILVESQTSRYRLYLPLIVR